MAWGNFTWNAGHPWKYLTGIDFVQGVGPGHRLPPPPSSPQHHLRGWGGGAEASSALDSLLWTGLCLCLSSAQLWNHGGASPGLEHSDWQFPSVE